MWPGNKTITFGYHVALLLTIIVQCNPFTVYGASEPDLFYTEIFKKVVISALLFLTLFQLRIS